MVVQDATIVRTSSSSRGRNGWYKARGVVAMLATCNNHGSRSPVSSYHSDTGQCQLVEVGGIEVPQ